MRSFDDFKADVYARRDELLRVRRKRRRIFISCVPLVFCVVIALIFINGDFFARNKSSDSVMDETEEYYEETLYEDTNGTDRGEGEVVENTDDFEILPDSASSYVNYMTSQVEITDGNSESKTNATASNEGGSPSYHSTMSAQIEVSDGKISTCHLLNDEQEAKTVLQLITLTGAIDSELEPPAERVTVYLREYDMVTIYYYQGNSDKEPPEHEHAKIMSAQVADGILKYLEERK